MIYRIKRWFVWRKFYNANKHLGEIGLIDLVNEMYDKSI